MLEGRSLSTQKPRVLLWGGKSQARIVAEMLRETDQAEVAVVFDNLLLEPYFSSPGVFVNDVETLKTFLPTVSHYVVCIGGEHGFARTMAARALSILGLKPLNIAHGKSHVEPSSERGSGHQLMPFAVVHKFCTIGHQAILNTNAVLDHECVLGDCVHVMGSAAVAGQVMIGNYVTIGTNATILPSLTIGEGAYIGAGAVVCRDVEPYAVMVGAPARKLRTRTHAFNEKIISSLTNVHGNFGGSAVLPSV